MTITKGQVAQLWNKYKVNVLGMSFDTLLHADPGLIYDLVAMDRGKAVETNEALASEDILAAYKHFFVEEPTGNGETTNSPTGTLPPENC